MKLSEIKSIGPSAEESLHKLGIKTPYDLITFYPFRYDVIKILCI